MYTLALLARDGDPDALLPYLPAYLSIYLASQLLASAVYLELFDRELQYDYGASTHLTCQARCCLLFVALLWAERQPERARSEWPRGGS